MIDKPAVGAKAVRVIMEHTSKQGEPRIPRACTYPLTAAGCVKSIYANLVVVDVTPRGLVVIEMNAGMTLEKLQALSGPRLQPAPDGQMLAPPGTQEARATWSMIRKSGYRFSEKIMVKQKDRASEDSTKGHLALGRPCVNKCVPRGEDRQANLRPFIHSTLGFRARRRGLAFPVLPVFGKDGGSKWGC